MANTDVSVALHSYFPFKRKDGSASIMKGSFSCCIKIGEYRIRVVDCAHFVAPDKTWCGFPQKQIGFKDAEEKKYIPIVFFDNKEQNQQIKTLMLEAVEAYLQKHGKKEDELIQDSTDEFPF